MSQLRARLEPLALAVVGGAAILWAGGFGYLAVVRHLAGGSHAEDLGFTDQLLWNFLRGQWFRTSIYSGATWNTEIDVSRLARPDSLLAFHVEPMLLAFVPLYAVGGGPVALLVSQVLAVAAGTLPVYRLGRHLGGSPLAGVAVAGAYLLSPLGQWAVLADFHTSTLAAPLLLLSLERLVVARAPVQALLVASVAVTAREDVGLVLAALALFIAFRTEKRSIAAAFATLGVGWTILSLVVIRSYSGGISPFDVRYGATLGAGIGPSLAALVRPTVLEYAAALLLSGGWLGVFAPLSLLPALPSLALNAFSTSPWMAAGKAHYSGLVLPFIVLGAAVGLGALRGRRGLQRAASGALVLTGVAGYVLAGAGPFGGNYAPASLTDHARAALTIASGLPADAAISASAPLVPRVSQRRRVYVFPSVQDADYVFLDLHASPAPTSAGDVFLRVQALFASGDWQVANETDGLLLLQRTTAAAPARMASLSATTSEHMLESPRLLSAALVPSPEGAADVDGPRWILRTTWQTDWPLPSGTHLEFWVDLLNGDRLHLWDIAALWWNPPERWNPGQPVTVDVPDIPIREFRSWSAAWSSP